MEPILRCRDTIGFFLFKAPSLIIKGEWVIDNWSVILWIFCFFFIHRIYVLSPFILRSLSVLMIVVGSLITLLTWLVSTSELWDWKKHEQWWDNAPWVLLELMLFWLQIMYLTFSFGGQLILSALFYEAVIVAELIGLSISLPLSSPFLFLTPFH